MSRIGNRTNFPFKDIPKGFTLEIRESTVAKAPRPFLVPTDYEGVQHVKLFAAHSERNRKQVEDGAIRLYVDLRVVYAKTREVTEFVSL